MNPSLMSIDVYECSKDEVYLAYCLDMVGQLKEAGAKAIVVDCRGIYPLASSRITEYYRSLHATGLVIFAVYGNWRTIDTNFTAVVMTANSGTRRLGRFHKFYAIGYGGYPDLLFELLRRHQGYSKDIAFTVNKTIAQLGDYRVPLDKDGSFCMDIDAGRIVAYEKVSPVYTLFNIKTGKLEYYGWNSHNVPDQKEKPLLETFGKRFKDKFVMITNQSDYNYYSESDYGNIYPVAFENLLAQDTFLPKPWLEYLVMGIFLLLCATACTWLRFSYAVPLILILYGGSAYLVDYLQFAQYWYFPGAAFSNAAIASSILFPLLRIFHDHRTREETV